MYRETGRFLHEQRHSALLFCALLVSLMGGCGEKEPSPNELRSAQTIREFGGQVKMRGKKHVEVYLRGTKVSDGDLPLLRDLPDLELLNLQDTSITDAGLEHVGRLQGLKRLSLQRSKVKDAGMEHLSGLTSMVELDLVGLPITDAGLEHLHGLRNLEKIYFDPGRTTPDAVRRLQDAAPKAKIFSDKRPGSVRAHEPGSRHVIEC
jgi:hypothetical protein